MERIKLNSIEKLQNELTYSFEVSEGLKKYFTGKPFVIKYPECIENVPDSVLSIPFVVNVLPIIWLTHSELQLNELDQDFFDAIPEIQEGYQTMYPESEFKGEITVGKVVANSRNSRTAKSAILFSGGLDAVTTMLRHLEESPLLVSIWGADIEYDNEDGWKTAGKSMKEAADLFGLDIVTVRSAFRQFDSELHLDIDFYTQLKRGWWYGVKHGIGIIGHVAPLAWLRGLSTVYIASSNNVRDGVVRCASDPKIDNHVAYCGCKVIHDNFESTRQDKTKYLIQYRKDHNLDHIPLHVCWESPTGENCSHCEKCYRTMVGFWIEGEDPVHYGFKYDRSVFKDIYKKLALNQKKFSAPKEWTYMKEALNSNWDHLSDKKYRNGLKWMRTYNFFDVNSNSCKRKNDRLISIKTRLINGLPGLYKGYKKLRGK
ncbi:MAG: hypothetical protein Q4C20_01240 [Erysipelotrichaceae bacterium]|nr:hypothetical protein [Erysipelotrichaceae bacterium]